MEHKVLSEKYEFKTILSTLDCDTSRLLIIIRLMDVQQLIQTIAFSLPGLLMAIVAHEWAHGYMAKRFGDRTAEMAGRLTLNPAVHIDPFGTVVLPLILLSFGGMMFGYAKPVPVDTRNFKDYKKGIFWVSFAGPLMNFILGTISAFLFAVVITQVPQDSSSFKPAVEILRFSMQINFVLGAFNLIPIPPLDGSKMLAVFLKGQALRQYEALAQYSNFIFIGLIALSYAGVPSFSLVITPVVMFGQKLTMAFLYLLG